MGPDPHAAPGDDDPGAGYHTPTGAPCPRTVRLDGGIDGNGQCFGCGTCLQLADLAWPG